jgi:hypothetical protein
MLQPQPSSRRNPSQGCILGRPGSCLHAGDGAETEGLCSPSTRLGLLVEIVLVARLISLVTVVIGSTYAFVAGPRLAVVGDVLGVRAVKPQTQDPGEKVDLCRRRLLTTS